jgi:hypothetical protein
MQKVALSSYDKKVIQKLVKRALDDGSPVEADKRKSYIIQVANFYSEIFEPLLNHLLINKYKELGKWSNSRERDLIIKGSIETIVDLRKWFDDRELEYNEIINKNKDGNPPSEEDSEKIISSYI